MLNETERMYFAYLCENHPETADEYWRRLDEQDEVLSTIERSYQQPAYDPYEIFNPPRSLIVDKVKEIDNEAYLLLKEMQAIKSNPDAPLLMADLQTRHQKLVIKSKAMKQKINNHKKTGSWTEINDGRFTDQDKERVKSVPIENFYPGKFKSSGGRQFGICPFHNEKTGSFVVYKKSNSYHCFGCGENGDVIKFVQKMQNLSFVEAVRFLMAML